MEKNNLNIVENEQNKSPYIGGSNNNNNILSHSQVSCVKYLLKPSDFLYSINIYLRLQQMLNLLVYTKLDCQI